MLPIGLAVYVVAALVFLPAWVIFLDLGAASLVQVYLRISTICLEPAWHYRREASVYFVMSLDSKRCDVSNLRGWVNLEKIFIR